MIEARETLYMNLMSRVGSASPTVLMRLSSDPQLATLMALSQFYLEPLIIHTCATPHTEDADKLTKDTRSSNSKRDNGQGTSVFRGHRNSNNSPASKS
jgi:hypothetical protein